MSTIDKLHTVLTVIIWTLLGLLLLAIALGYVPDAMADAPAPQELQAVAWLPLMARPRPETSIRLQPSMAVVEPGMLATLELWAEDINTDRWAATLWWEDPVRVVGADYEGGLWDPVTRFDIAPVWSEYSVGLEQWSLSVAASESAHLATFPLMCDGVKDGWVWLDVMVNVGPQRYVTQQILRAVPCVAELTGDGVRDADDVSRVAAAMGCRLGAPCYDPLMDFDADYEITGQDVGVASLYWGVECP